MVPAALSRICDESGRLGRESRRGGAMTLRSEKDVILEHALRDTENLQIALKIGAAYTDLCTRVITDFIKLVETRLAAQMGSTWKVCMGDVNTFASRWTTFLQADSLAHPGQFAVVLGGDGSGYPKKVYLAVHSTSAKESHESFRTRINRLYAKG